MRRFAIAVSGMLLATCLVANPDRAQAGAMVTADILTPAPFAALGTKNTTELRAYSQTAGLTNNDFFGDLTSGGMAVNPAPNGAVLAKIQNISVMGKNGVTAYAPVVGLANQPKANIKQAGDIQSLFSLTGVYTGSGNQFQQPSGRFLAALGFTTGVGKPPPGAAAGAAFDPVTVPSGSILPYAPTIGATMQLGDANISGGLDVYAVDSTVFTSANVADFLNDGSPFADTLWHLNLAADGPLGGTSDVGVDFELNPLALQEIAFPSSYLFSLPGYSPSLSDQKVAMLIDSAVDSAIVGALGFAGGNVSLPDFAPFPAGTQYVTTSDVEYAQGVDAGLDVVPEPGSTSLLASGLLVFFGLRRFRQKSNEVAAIGGTQHSRSIQRYWYRHLPRRG
jgi:hypothetical protein